MVTGQMKMVLDYVKERDNAIHSGDFEEFKRFQYKWQKKGILPAVSSEDVLRISFYKLMYNVPGTPPEKKREAEEWLTSHNYGLKL